MTTRHPRLSRGLGAAVLLALTLTAAGCGSPSTGATSGSSTGAGAAAGSAARLSGTLPVLAAASLTESFAAIAKDFESANPDVDVQVSYGSSSTLVQQVNHGAPADVIAWAGEAAARPLDPTLARDRRVFATNVLEIAVPPSNPAGITGLSDLGRPGLKVVLCAPTVPCGMAADATFTKAGVEPAVVSREVDVKATLAKVRLGEADAAVVYHSDVVAAKDAVKGIAIPASLNTSLRYPIIRLDDNSAGRAFVDFVLSDQSRQTLTSFGLASP